MARMLTVVGDKTSQQAYHRVLKRALSVARVQPIPVASREAAGDSDGFVFSSMARQPSDQLMSIAPMCATHAALWPHHNGVL